MRALHFLAALVLAGALHAQLPCNCDPSQPETMKARPCSLCAEAEKHPADQPVFFLKDINPTKPNRMLALPRMHTPGNHRLMDLPAEARLALWQSAMEKAKSIWGEDWAVAYNSMRVRTQCHAHVHIGKLLPGVETDNFIVIHSLAEIPVLPDDGGIWVHPVGGALHVHTGEYITETVLLR